MVVEIIWITWEDHLYLFIHVMFFQGYLLFIILVLTYLKGDAVL